MKEIMVEHFAIMITKLEKKRLFTQFKTTDDGKDI